MKSDHTSDGNKVEILEDLIYSLLCNGKVNIADIDQPVRMRNIQFYWYARRHCGYLKSARDRKRYHSILKLMNEDIAARYEAGLDNSMFVETFNCFTRLAMRNMRYRWLCFFEKSKKKK